MKLELILVLLFIITICIVGILLCIFTLKSNGFGKIPLPPKHLKR